MADPQTFQSWRNALPETLARLDAEVLGAEVGIEFAYEQARLFHAAKEVPNVDQSRLSFFTSPLESAWKGEAERLKNLRDGLKRKREIYRRFHGRYEAQIEKTESCPVCGQGGFVVKEQTLAMHVRLVHEPAASAKRPETVAGQGSTGQPQTTVAFTDPKPDTTKSATLTFTEVP